MTPFELAARGFAVFALRPNEKTPLERGWQRAATCDPFVALDRIPEAANAATATGSGLLVVDVDIAKGGFATFEALGPWPETFTVETASGGRHYYFRTAKRLGNSVGKLGPGVDTRGEGGYVVAPGSRIGDREYRVLVDAEIAELPQGISERLVAVPERKAEAVEVLGDIDSPGSVAMARATAAAWTPAPEGERNAAAYRLACRLFDFAVSEAVCRELVFEWDTRNDPPIQDEPEGEEEIARTVASALTSRQDPIGRDNDDRHFDVVPEPPAPEPKTAADLLRFPCEVSVPDLIARQSAALVKGIVGRAACGVMYGASTAGKTFVALDMGWHIATGREWLQRKTRRAPVLYVSLEGDEGFQKRVAALTISMGDPGQWFAQIKGFPLLTRGELGTEGERLIIEAAKMLEALAGEPVGLIFIDTMARAMAGDDENDAKDMMHFVQHRCAAITAATGASICIVHHENKSGVIRGSGALFAACDFVIRAERDGDQRRLIGEKVKDGRDGIALADYCLDVVTLGEDADGEPVTSCVVRVGMSERTRQCGAVMVGRLRELLRAGETITLKPRAPTFGPTAVAARWPDLGFTREDYLAAWPEAQTHFATEIVKARGREVVRLALT